MKYDDEFLETKFHVISKFPQIHNNFNLIKRIGQGSFSRVYLASLKNINDDVKFALKYIIPISHPRRIANELKFMKILGGRNNVVQVFACIRKFDEIILVMPYINHNKFIEYYRSLSFFEIVDYMKNLLIALEWIHRKGIIHRDIKPANFLFDRQNKKYTLIDFGLAEQENKYLHHKVKNSYSTTTFLNKIPKNFEKKRGILKSCENLQTLKFKEILKKKCKCVKKNLICHRCLQLPKQKAPRAGTAGFRSPEILLKFTYQTTSIDIWAAGVIFLILLSGRYPFFCYSDDLGSLAELITIFGTDAITNAACDLRKFVICSQNCPAIDLKELCTKLNPAILHISDLAFDLLYSMLNVNFEKRISATFALKHAFFNETFSSDF